MNQPKFQIGDTVVIDSHWMGSVHQNRLCTICGIKSVQTQANEGEAVRNHWGYVLDCPWDTEGVLHRLENRPIIEGLLSLVEPKGRNYVVGEDGIIYCGRLTLAECIRSAKESPRKQVYRLVLVEDLQAENLRESENP